jgi:hypothetical protein
MPNRSAPARPPRSSRLLGARRCALGAALLGHLALGCGSEIRGDGPSRIEGVEAPAPGSPEPGTESGGPAENVESPSTALDFGLTDDQPGEVEVVCAARAAASELRRVSLAFVFDVSASMGGNDRSRYETKWLPVVAASEAFFATTDAAALSASLTFFPRPDAATRCTARAYQAPDVAEQPLPSAAFASAIGDLGYTLGSGNWRTTTPTLAAFSGVASAMLAADAQDDTTRAIVMVTDGVPQGCNGSDDVQLVARSVRDSGIQTFVVGVANPPGDNAGDNLENLDVIAEAGGTGQAFIVATGDPAQTEADFRAVIDGIRGIALACDVEIPVPPACSAFLPDQVNVVYEAGAGGPTALSYDPACSAPDTWRYDDPAAPATIVLCNDTCDRVQRDASARLTVEFGCERRGLPR